MSEPVNYHEAKKQWEINFLKSAIERHGGNQSKAAIEIGLSKANFNHKIGSLGFPKKYSGQPRKEKLRVK